MGLRSFVLAAALAVLFVSRSGAAVVFNFVLDPATTAGGGSTSTQLGLGTYHLYAYDDTLGSQGIAAYNVELTGVDSVFDRTPTTTWTDADDNSWDAGFGLLRSTLYGSTLVAGQPLMPLDPTGQPPPITGLGRQAGDFAAAFPGAQSFTGTTSSAWGSNLTRPAHDPSLPWLLIAEGQYAPGGPGLVLGAQGTNVNLYNSQMRQVAADICLFSDGSCHSVRPTPPIVPDPLPPVEIPPPSNPPPPPVEVIVDDPPPGGPVIDEPPAEDPPAIDPWPNDAPPIGDLPSAEPDASSGPIYELPILDPIRFPYQLPFLRREYWVDTGEAIVQVFAGTIVFPGTIDRTDLPWHLAFDGAPAIMDFSRSNTPGAFLLHTSALAGGGLTIAAAADFGVPEPTSGLMLVGGLLASIVACGRRRV